METRALTINPGPRNPVIMGSVRLHYGAPTVDDFEGIAESHGNEAAVRDWEGDPLISQNLKKFSNIYFFKYCICGLFRCFFGGLICQCVYL